MPPGIPLDRRRGHRAKGSPYCGVENNEPHGQEGQGLKSIQVFVSQDPIILTGDQANLVDHQLLCGEGEEPEIKGGKERHFLLPEPREGLLNPDSVPCPAAHSLTQEGHTQERHEH